MFPLSPARLIAAANVYIGQGNDPAEDVGYQARTQDRVSLFLRDTHPLPESTTSAAFINHVGFWSHYEQLPGRSWWPLPAAPTCDALAEVASAKRVLSIGAPTEGELFLCWSPVHGEYSHTGIVLGLADEPRYVNGQWWYDCVTLEGNANPGGRGAPWWSYRARRRFSPELGDRFVKWMELDPRHGWSDPVVPVRWIPRGPTVRRAA